MIAQSQSGTGKTAAFVITMLSRVDPNLPIPQALCLAPTRELARQIMGVVQTMGQHMGVVAQFAIPGLVERGKKFTAHIVVGTPGTTMDCINRGYMSIDKLKVLVIDEADNMLDQQGLGEQCIRVKKYLSGFLHPFCTFTRLTIQSHPSPPPNPIVERHLSEKRHGLYQDVCA
jgi:ATP-dependent RNA helicase DDX19/DBP5